jgi:hypothetical protein
MTRINTRHAGLALAIALAGLSLPGCTITSTPQSQAAPGATRTAMESAVNETLSRLYNTVPGSQEMVTKAAGVLVFPSVLGGSFVVGAEHGKGALRVGGQTTNYYSTTGASVGFQAGGQSRSVIYVFNTRDALQKFRNSNGWTADADATVAIGNVGANIRRRRRAAHPMGSRPGRPPAGGRAPGRLAGRLRRCPGGRRHAGEQRRRGGPAGNPGPGAAADADPGHARGPGSPAAADRRLPGRHRQLGGTMSREVVVVSAVRTAIGTFGGSLKDVPPPNWARRSCANRWRAPAWTARTSAMWCSAMWSTPSRKDMYLSRVAAINGGCAEGTPAFNVNRLCGSGLQAIVSAAQAISWATPTSPSAAAPRT